MGTRGCCGIKVNDEYKATYNHFDSYPDALGLEVVKFCQKMNALNGWEKFKEECLKVKMVDEEKKPSPYLIEKYKKYANEGVSSGKLDEWYVLLRDIQFGRHLEEIYAGNLSHLIEGFDFLKDSLFCEYAYIINLDNMTLEFYKGFMKSPQEDNPLPFEQKSDDSGYYPVEFVGCLPLSDIPENWMEKMYPKEVEQESDV